MYETPVLEVYGTFRELTQNAKRQYMNDIASVNGQGGNTGCNPHPKNPGAHAGCVSA